MSEFDRPGVTLDKPAKRPSIGSRFGDLIERLARTFGGPERPERPERPEGPERPEDDWPRWRSTGEAEAVATAPIWDDVVPRFAIARQGYDRDAVDAHMEDLERQLAELRERTTPSGAVSAEIKKIGEQTAAILRVAHEQAAETTRRAQAQADSCIADAAANAISITEDANRKLRELDSETDAVWRERQRLMDDIRSVATSLLSLVEAAADRFPAESEKPQPGATEQFEPVAAEPAPDQPS